MIVTQQRAAALRDSAEQLIERVRELLHALCNQLFRDLLERNAMTFQLGDYRAGPLDVLLHDVRVTLPWSRNASIVAGGMVSTVSRPISASTYIVSL